MPERVTRSPQDWSARCSAFTGHHLYRGVLPGLEKQSAAAQPYERDEPLSLLIPAGGRRQAVFLRGVRRHGRSYGSMRGGSATLVNVAPMGGGKYTLILVPVQMQEIGREHGSYRYVIQGWLKPPCRLQTTWSNTALQAERTTRRWFTASSRRNCASSARLWALM